LMKLPRDLSWLLASLLGRIWHWSSNNSGDRRGRMRTFRGGRTCK
jgi:hypothetical protein